jgi:ATP-dependent protease HslVU (ClpYQ) peptidase subunit
MIPLVTLSTYAVDCFRRQSASVSAFNNLIRYIMAGIGSLVATDAENAMGSGALYSMCAGFTAVFFVLVIYVQKNPDKWR